MFPRKATASVIGIGGTLGAVGGMVMAQATGAILTATGNDDSVIFAACASAYLVALLAIHLLSPKLEVAKV